MVGFILITSANTGHEIGKIIGVPSESKNILVCNLSFHLAIQIFFGVPVVHFGLPSDTWHAGILHPAVATKIYIKQLERK